MFQYLQAIPDQEAHFARISPKLARALERSIQIINDRIMPKVATAAEVEPARTGLGLGLGLRLGKTAAAIQSVSLDAHNVIHE